MMDERIKGLIERIVLSEGMDLVRIDSKEGKNAFIRLYIDKPGGVTLEDCRLINEQVGAMLDVEDPIQQHYMLEVSSPGLDRPLFTEADYQKFSGKEVRLKTKAPLEGRTNFTGIIQSSENGIITLIEGSRVYRIPFTSIQKANLKLDLKKIGSGS